MHLCMYVQRAPSLSQHLVEPIIKFPGDGGKARIGRMQFIGPVGAIRQGAEKIDLENLPDVFRLQTVEHDVQRLDEFRYDRAPSAQIRIAASRDGKALFSKAFLEPRSDNPEGHRSSSIGPRVVVAVYENRQAGCLKKLLR
jgi:hypothetical protein